MLIVHRAERSDLLVEALADVLREPLDDPFQADVVAVPSRGIERWLSQRLSHRLGASPGREDGVCANLDMPFPGRLVAGALRAALGGTPDDDPWSADRAVWPVLQLIDAHRHEPWLQLLDAHLGDDAGDARPGRRFEVARRVADLFDRYAVHRPHMVQRWRDGDDVDGDGAHLPADLSWQPALWRALRERIGEPGPAERLELACDRIRADADAVELPRRLALFGLTRLPPSTLQVLDALGSHRDVHLMTLHPSPVLWDRVAAGGGTTAGARSPLLATWGKDVREMQLAVQLGAPTATSRHHGDQRPAEPTTLLRRLQRDIHADIGPGSPVIGADDDRLVIAPDDDSVQVHSCHGRARQVEAMRDAILHLLADDPTLEPRDVIVMCPDIETFAPLIHASFGTALDRDDGDATLHVRLADRALRQSNPMLAGISTLLDLTAARVSAPELIDFLGAPPVRRRFRVDDDDLDRIEGWAATSGIRWGLDADHRRPFQLHQLHANTWASGVDRLLLGVGLSEDEHRLIGDVLPVDDVDSGDIELVGRLTEFVHRVRRALQRLTGPHSMDDWVQHLATSVDELMATSIGDSWQRAELDAVLRSITDESAAGDGVVMSIDEVRALLARRLDGRPGRSNFRTGHLTICTMVPMRSVPHRVIGLLGLDDGVFPRHGAPDGDDILLRAPQVGDHDVRTEDRQLLLDALLAARDHLVVTFSGRDERTNARRPPAVPIGELLDVIDASATTPTGSARTQVLVEHPLQPFDPRNFEPGRIIASRPWSFDRTAQRGARATQQEQRHRPPFLAGALADHRTPVIELDALVRFVQHPAKAFLRTRLDLSLADHDDELLDGIPLDLDNLERWDVGQRLLEARLDGATWDVALAAERSRGTLPPGPLGERILDGVTLMVEDLVGVATPERGGAQAGARDVHVELADGRTVSGTVTHIYGSAVVSVTYSRLAPKHRLASWVRAVGLAAGGHLRDGTSVAIGRSRREAGISRLGPIDPADATTILHELVDLYDRGMREPLPLYCKTSEALARGTEPRRSWTTGPGDRFDNEDRDPEHIRLFGGPLEFERLFDDSPRADESGPGWAMDRTSRVERYAARLWSPLLDHERREGL